jgi:hypothetical protein
MVADHLRLDVGWIDGEISAETDAKPQTVEERAGREHAHLPG